MEGSSGRSVQENPPVEAKDGHRSPGEVYFTFMVDCAVHEGYVSPEGAEAILQALYPKVRE